MPRSLASGRSYNIFVSTPSQQRSGPSADQPKPRVYTLEAAGLIIIAVLVLILTVVRYWQHIPWSAR